MGSKSKQEKSNEEFAQQDVAFNKACVLANVKATSRQASKFRNKKGMAWKVMKGLAEPLRFKMAGYVLDISHE